MAASDDIAFLESFRGKIAEFLVLGTAPTQDPLWGGSGLTKMKEAMQDPAFRALRRDINQMKGRAAGILTGLGIGCTFTQHPPPAVGGPAASFPLFDLITDNQSLHTIDGTVFADKIDEAIGLLRQSDGAQDAPFGPAAPVLAVRGLGRAREFYEQQLGFSCRLAKDGFAILERGAARIVLNAAAVPHPDGTGWDAMVAVPDPDGLAAEFAEKGVAPETPASDTNHGLRGFTLTDPDGYVLFFGRPA